MTNKFLKAIVQSVKDELPQFNKVLMREVRQKMIANLCYDIEDILQYLLLNPYPHITYHGLEQVGPKEYATYIVKNKWQNVDIHDSNFKLMKYKFTLNENGTEIECPLFLYLPYLFEESFTLRGTQYYPMFTIMDKSIIRIRNRTKKDAVHGFIGIEIPTILQKVIFHFNEKNRHYFRDTENNVYEGTVIRVKVHHNITSELPPAILYIFARYGFREGMKFLGYNADDFHLTTSLSVSDSHKSFEVGNGVWLTAPNEYIEDIQKRRLLAGLLLLLDSSSIQSDKILSEPDGEYFKYLLGKWIQKPGASLLQQINQAVEHLRTTDRTIDYRCRANLQSDGIMIEDFYDLCKYLFFSIDEILVHKNNNLFHKKISLAPQMLYGFTKIVSGELFRCAQSNEPIKADTLNRIFRKVTKLPIKHIERMSGVWMTHGDQCNDSWILGTGSKKLRQEGIRNPFEISEGGKAPDGGLRSDTSILAHPSHLLIESILNLPASSPCTGGTINPFFQGVTIDGLFYKPPIYEIIKDVFHSSGAHVDVLLTNEDIELVDPEDWIDIEDDDE